MSELTTTISVRRTAAENEQLLYEISAVAATDLAKAAEMANAALSEGLEHQLLLNLVADKLIELRRFPEAMSLLNRAVALDPLDVYTWNAVGLCMAQQDLRREAANAYEHALSIQPDFPQAHYHLGSMLERMGDHDGAQSHYERALEVGPGYADPMGGLASLAVRRGDAATGRVFAAQALAIEPNQPTAIAALAKVELNEKNFAQAEYRLRDLKDNVGLDRFDRPTAHCMLGDALDGLGRTEEAFAEYQAGKAGFREVYGARFEQPGVESQRELAERLTGYFTAAPVEAWSSAAPLAPNEARPALGHAFLVGFPRTGTTLLEHVLASHPDMINIDERATLRVIEDGYFTDDQALGRLASLEVDQAAAHRRTYWDRIHDLNIATDGRVVIDKMPLYSVKLPIISKLFPGVKVLLAQRDPRDVVLSCFRRPFQMNVGMYEFVTLHGAALYYDAVMRLVEVYRSKLPLDLHVVRYESLVADFEGQTRAICDFLGVSWSDSMADFAENAKKRQIRTPSAPQVREGLYTTGAGQWRRYAKQLEPVMPILAPWIEKMGYDPA
jgi:Tfp pilus assembly protein PilF